MSGWMRGWWAVSLVLWLASPARAQDADGGVGAAAPGATPERDGWAESVGGPPGPGIVGWLDLTGAIRAGYWSSTRALDANRHLGAGMLWLKTSRRLSRRVSFLAEGWAALSGPLEDGRAKGELREAFVELAFGRLDVRAGRQIIAWGRADGVNPTDNLSGQDQTLLAPDDADRRLGTTAVRASYYVGDVSLTGVWLPEFRGHAFALPAFAEATADKPGPDVSFAREGERWPGDQWAVRVEQTGRAVDWSASYFQGKDMAPDLGVSMVSAVSAAAEREAGARDLAFRILLSHHRVRVFGADMTANLGRFGMRAEGAFVETDDSAGIDPFTKNPFVFVVAGVDRTWMGLLNLNVQYLFRYVLDDLAQPADGSGFAALVAAQQAVLNSQTQRTQHGASLRIGYKWRHETIEGELAAAGYAGPSGLTLRPKVLYAVTDDWKAVLGAELFRGETASLFGLLRDNSTGYAELRWSF